MNAKRILIADDMTSGRELIRTVLERAGYSVFEAADGQQALEMANRERPDLIILDVQMPILNGYQVLERLREDPRFNRAPIIALTANAMQGDKDKALAAGFTAYVPKPVSLSQLREQVSVLLG
jgi:two-component system cell cycle response regulator DivK